MTPCLETLFGDAGSANHDLLLQDQPFQLPLPEDAVTFEVSADNNCVDIQLLQLPMGDEIDANVYPFEFSSSLPADAHRQVFMLPTENDYTLRYNPVFSQPMDDDTSANLVPIDRRPFLPSPQLKLPETVDTIAVVHDLLDGQPYSHHPAVDATALTPSPASTQTLGLDLSPSGPLQNHTWFRWVQASAADHLHGYLPSSSSPMMAGFSDFPVFPTPQSPTLFSGVSAALHPAGACLPLNALGSPQPPRQERNEIHALASIGRKRPLDQTQPPTRPAKRFATILSRPPTIHPSSAGGISMMANPPAKSKTKQAGVPADMVTTFRLDGSRVPKSPGRRTRSTKVCLRCRTQRQKVSLFRCEDSCF